MSDAGARYGNGRCTHRDHDVDYSQRTGPYVEAIDAWLEHHDPLTRAEFDRLNSTLVRTVGDAATHPEQGRNRHLRHADASAFGQFAAESDVALVELDTDARYGDLHGFPVYGGQRWVPILVTIDDAGGIERVARRMHESYHVVEAIVPDDLIHNVEVLTDGGVDRERIELYLDRHPESSAAQVRGRFGLAPDELAALDTSADTDSPDSPREGTSEGGSGDSNPTFEAGEPPSPNRECGAWIDARFDAPESGVWPPELLDREQWMGHREKKPFAPWADRTHPDADPGEDARWKWSITENYVDGETVAMAEADPRLDGRVFLQTDDDPFAYVDGDDVRDPETGAVHPAFLAVLDALGITYADVSQSGGGAHAVYRGDLPEGVKQAAWQLDDEPFGANDADDLPSVEVYARKRVCVATGKHVPGTPTEAREWDSEALRALLDENDQLPEPVRTPEATRESFDANAWEPKATDAGETTDEIRDLFAALDRLDARRVAERTIVASWNDDASTSEGKRAFSPTWGANSNGTANVVDSRIWQDTGDEGGYGTPVVMALIDAGEMSHRNASPRKARGALWWRGIEHLRDLGFAIPELDSSDESGAGGGEPVAVLPEHTPRAQAAANGWNWYTADRADDSALTVEDARERTREAVGDAYESGGSWLIEALPTMGKSFAAVVAALDADEPVTILTGRGNKEQYKQYREWCEEHGLRAKVLPSVWRDCEAFAGEYGVGVAETVKEWYNRGATGKDIHIHYEDETGEPIPCDGPAGARCSYKAGWQFDAEDYDVLIGHYNHAHVNSVTKSRTVVLDEFPGNAFETTLDGRLAGAVTRFLKQHRASDALPDDYADLMDARNDDARRADALAWFADHNPDRDGTLAFDPSGEGHAVAPLAAFTLLAAAENDLSNGWERVELPDGRGIGLFDREEGCVHLLQPPVLRYARGVVALDGTPTPALWRLVTGERLNHRPVLTDAERVEYIRETLGLNLVRTTDAVKPYSGNTEFVADEQDAALLDAIAEEHGREPALLTTLTAERSHENTGLYETDGDGGLVEGNGRVAELANYGDLKGSNRFKSTRLGAVIGSRNFGDGFVQKWGAFAGEAVERGDGRGVDLEYSGIGHQIHRHMTHHETLQAVMRFGRDGGGATVYVHTNTLPEWVEDGALAGEGRVLRTYSDGERQVLDALDSDVIGDEWTTAEVADHPAVEIGARQVRDHLHRFADRGYVEGEIEGNGFVWRDDGLHRVSDHGEVELAPVETDDLTEEESAELARTTTYTWEFRTSRFSTGSESTGDASGGEPPDPAPAGGATRPSDPPD